MQCSHMLHPVICLAFHASRSPHYSRAAVENTDILTCVIFFMPQIPINLTVCLHKREFPEGHKKRGNFVSLLSLDLFRMSGRGLPGSESV